VAETNRKHRNLAAQHHQKTYTRAVQHRLLDGERPLSTNPIREKPPSNHEDTAPSGFRDVKRWHGLIVTLKVWLWFRVTRAIPGTVLAAILTCLEYFW